MNLVFDNMISGVKEGSRNVRLARFLEGVSQSFIWWRGKQ